MPEGIKHEGICVTLSLDKSVMLLYHYTKRRHNHFVPIVKSKVTISFPWVYEVFKEILIIVNKKMLKWEAFLERM